MRPNNRQRSRGGRNSGGGGGHGHHKQHHNPNRPPNRNQIFDSSGPDVRVRGNAHQVFDKYQALAREAAASGDRIMAEAYWQYADHYFRMIQSMGGFTHRNNQGWGDGGEEGQQANPQAQGQSNPSPQANGNGAGYSPDASRGEDQGESEPGLGNVAFLQNGRGMPAGSDPAAEDQPDVPAFTPAGGRRS
ncbi:MAG: DUF4167 domain-containing protein [Proteobacteria bacterium]|nr:DUF4167 domain-containing protein [Pseudomonadota bacterium]